MARKVPQHVAEAKLMFVSMQTVPVVGTTADVSAVQSDTHRQFNAIERTQLLPSRPHDALRVCVCRKRTAGGH